MTLFDDYMVLRYATRDWQPVFLLAEVCYTNYLPAVLQRGLLPERAVFPDGQE